MKIRVITINFTRFVIEVQPQDKVSDVKKKIDTVQGDDLYPAAQQLLLHSGKVLKESTTLEENSVKDGSFVVIMLSRSKVPASGGSAASASPASTVPPTKVQPSTVPAAPTPLSASRSTHVSARTPARPMPAYLYIDTSGTARRVIDTFGFWNGDTVTYPLRAANNNPESAAKYLCSPMLQELGKQNPNLMRLIQEHQTDFPTPEKHEVDHGLQLLVKPLAGNTFTVHIPSKLSVVMTLMKKIEQKVGHTSFYLCYGPRILSNNYEPLSYYGIESGCNITMHARLNGGMGAVRNTAKWVDNFSNVFKTQMGGFFIELRTMQRPLTEAERKLPLTDKPSTRWLPEWIKTRTKSRPDKVVGRSLTIEYIYDDGGAGGSGGIRGASAGGSGIFRGTAVAGITGYAAGPSGESDSKDGGQNSDQNDGAGNSKIADENDGAGYSENNHPAFDEEDHDDRDSFSGYLLTNSNT